VDFNLAFIPRTFAIQSKEAFDPAYMSQLFEVGYRDVLENRCWVKRPPGIDVVKIETSPSVDVAP
jgi:hypothetical protein